MNYNYNENTLLHSIGFNFFRLESILEHGIVSYERAQKDNITYTKNYLPDNQKHSYISFTRVGSIDFSQKSTAYDVYVKRGITFIVEDVSFIEDKMHFHHHRDDEVLVEDMVLPSFIKGIIIPKNIENYYVSELGILPNNITKYTYIYEIVMNYINFLNKHGGKVDMKVILEVYLKEILLINNALYSIKDSEDNEVDKEELMDDYKEVIRELNSYLGDATFDTFSKILGHPATLRDVVEYLTKGEYPIYDMPYALIEEQKRAQ